MRRSIVFLGILFAFVIVVPVAQGDQTPAPTIDVARAQAFVGTWVSPWGPFCTPCILNIQKVEANGRVVVTAKNSYGEPWQRRNMVVTMKKGRMILTFINTKMNWLLEAELPNGKYMDIYREQYSFRYTRQ